VKVIDKVLPKQFFKYLKLNDTKDGHQRASFENGKVFIHVNSPVLKKYFGEHQEVLNGKKERSAVAMLLTLHCNAYQEKWRDIW
jgi:hypothetical protein